MNLDFKARVIFLNGSNNRKTSMHMNNVIAEILTW
jgi:hypothetical protein